MFGHKYTAPPQLITMFKYQRKQKKKVLKHSTPSKAGAEDEAAVMSEVGQREAPEECHAT